MKKFINRPEDVVEEMLEGLLVLHPGAARLAEHKVIVRADADHARDRQVAVLSGGGSGHEPAHAGYIGAGMLSAAVLGEVFASPGSDSVLAAIRAVSGQPGALLVVKNYTGDRLNFGVAAEMARAQGIPVETILVEDDVALKETAQPAGARGLAGTVLIHKLVGAAAAEGRSLSELASIGRAAVESLSTMGVSLSAGTSPITGRASFTLGEGEMELGLGIHGEPGILRTELQTADELVETLLGTLLKHGEFGADKRVALLINNLGATTHMELAIVARHAKPFLEQHGYVVERVYAGTFLSSLDMAGLSISVLGLHDDWLGLLDAPTTAPAWPNAPRQPPGTQVARRSPQPGIPPSPPAGTGLQSQAGGKTQRAIEAACKALIQAEPELTELDRITGDGDLGASMERAARAVLSALPSFPLADIPATLRSIAETLRRDVGGSSGPLYAVFFLRCATVLQHSRASGLTRWAEALDGGCHAISELGGAHPGDRTMLDALHPFAQALNEGREAAAESDVLHRALHAAERGAEATAQMHPRFGRSSYLGARVLGHPDPGAIAVAIWLRAAVEAILS